ncbi:MAG TPA: hypothetical protein VN035_02575 [Microbacterium sp.]|nr:hypothetical protein [Microbacterium sp.]
MIKTPSPARLRAALLLPGALVAAGILLAGCAATTAADASSDRTTTEGADAADAPAQERTPSGVTGLIASAESGLLQVQTDDEQTAVRYADDTSVTRTVSTDGSAIAVGDCVRVVPDEEGTTATTISITAAAEDGTCTGFGDEMPGDGERPIGDDSDGEMPGGEPTDAPTAAPADGERSEGTDDSGGAPTGFGDIIAGTVTAASDGSLTIEPTGDDADTSEIAYSADTVVTTTVDATAADVATGLCVTATGEADDAGGYDAESLVLSDPDESGECATGRGGFPGGGMPGGQAPGQASDEDAEEDSGE